MPAANNTPKSSVSSDRSSTPTSAVRALYQSINHPLDRTASDSGLESTIDSTVMSPTVNPVHPVSRNPPGTPRPLGWYRDSSVNNSSSQTANHQTNQQPPSIPPTTGAGAANQQTNQQPPTVDTGAAIHICHWHGDCYVNMNHPGVSLGALFGLSTAHLDHQNPEHRQ